MKKSLALLASLLTFSAIAADPQFDNISKKDVENVSKEFGTNFAHTTVAAPETDGLWSVEVGLVGGQTESPKFKKVIENSGGSGGDFDNIYHAALVGRVTFPLEFFVEASILPEQEIGGVEIKSNSFSAGWNIGRFTKLPLDITLGYDHAKGEISFHQDADIPNSVPAADIDLETTTKVMWVGVSKTFVFVTPYLKVGTAKVDGDLNATAQIFNVGGQTSESVSVDGGYLAAGVNVQLLIFRLGVEMTQMLDTKRISGKFSFAF